MEDSWGFLDVLPTDAVLEIVSYLDLPSRLALALTCRPLYASYWPGRDRSYNPLDFLDECASCGYIGLLKYAYENGALLDESVRYRAIEASHLELVRWLRPLVPLSNPFHAATRAALVGNKEILEMFSDRATMGLLVCEAARGGHADLVRDLISRVEGWSLPRGRLKLWQTALDNGHFEAAEILFENEKDNSSNGPRANILRAAIKFGNREKFLESMVEPNPMEISLLIGANVSLEFQIFILENYKGINLRIVFDNISEGTNLSVATLTYLSEKGLDFSKVSGEKLLKERRDPKTKAIIVPKEQFLCLKFAYEKGLRWRGPEIHAAILWATASQFEWLADVATDTDISIRLALVFTFLASYTSDKADMLDLLFETYPSLKKEPLILGRRALANPNALVVIEALAQRGIDPPFQSELRPLVNFYIDTHNPKLQDLGFRKRYHHWVTVLRWLADHGVAFDKESVAKLRTIPNRYFQRELEVLLKRPLPENKT